MVEGGVVVLSGRERGEGELEGPTRALLCDACLTSPRKITRLLDRSFIAVVGDCCTSFGSWFVDEEEVMEYTDGEYEGY